MTASLEVGDYVVIKRKSSGDDGGTSVSGPVLEMSDTGATIGVKDGEPVHVSWDDIAASSVVRITGDSGDINIDVG